MAHEPGAGLKRRFERYAIYWTPEPGSRWAEFGRAWLGYDADTGSPVTERDDRGLGRDRLDRLTNVPRRYGFHGTLLPPHQLGAGISAIELDARLRGFAAKRPPVDVGALQLARLFDFLALVPRTDIPALRRLHTECAFAFDRFWAPLTQAERVMQSSPDLSPTQRLMLAQWGYPRMLADFPFHLTLTGPLEPAESDAIAGELAARLGDVCEPPLTLESLSLCGDPGAGRPFRVIARYPLQG